MSADRYNQGKPMLSFVLQFPTAVEAFSRVKEIGAIKYARDNWRKGGKPDHEYLDAALRHIMAYMDGEVFAEDTGCTHLGHAMWNIMALQELNNKGVTHDPELFEEMCDYWASVKKAKDNGVDPPTLDEWRDSRADNSQYEGETRTFQTLDVPALDRIFEFEEPLTVRNGQTLHLDLTEGEATVANENGDIIDRTNIKGAEVIDDVFKCESPFGIPQNPLGPAKPAKTTEAEEAMLRKIFGRE